MTPLLSTALLCCLGLVLGLGACTTRTGSDSRGESRFDPRAIAKSDIDRVAAAAGLAAANKAQVAPHVALMNQQLIEMRQLTAHARKDAPKAEQDRMHKDLAAYYAVFKQHWDAARALVPPAKQPAFDAAIRTEMSGGRRVGNPHPTMPPTHPKMNPHTGKPIK